jgi:hypothetical protein
MNEELKKIDVWMKCNKLSVNIEKTNYIIFKKTGANFSLCFGNELLEQKKSIIFLGVYIDEHLLNVERPHISVKISQSRLVQGRI